MASKIRSRRTVIAAGVMSLALVAPLTPAVSDNATFGLPIASAATDLSVFDKRYDTENAFNKTRVEVLGLKLEPGDELIPRTALSVTSNPDFTFENDNGTLYVVRQKTKNAKVGNQDIDVFFEPAGGGSHRTTLRLNVPNQPDSSFPLAGFDTATRESVDFSDGKPKRVESITLPADATIESTMGGLNPWKVSNDQGVARITAPDNFVGNDADVDIPVRITAQSGDQFTSVIKIRATKPPAENLPTWLKYIAQVLSIVAGTGGGASGANGGGGSSISGLQGIFEGMFKDAVKIEIHQPTINGNIENNANGNGQVHPSAVNVSGNGVVQPSAVIVTDNAKMEPSAVNVSAVIEPSAVNVNAEMKPSAVNVEVQPSAISNNANGNFTDLLGRGKKNSGGAAGANGGDENGSSKGENGKMSKECVGALVGLGVPLAALIPVLLANVFRIPGFEGIQDAMKKAAGALPGLNITEAQLGAGVGAFAGALAAGFVGSLAICVPNKNKASESSVTATPTTVTPTSGAAAPSPDAPSKASGSSTTTTEKSAEPSPAN